MIVNERRGVAPSLLRLRHEDRPYYFELANGWHAFGMPEECAEGGGILGLLSAG